jgi:hypothetical protein
MLVSHTRKFIFTKTTKTAGTSVESYFERYCMPEQEWSPRHGREEHVSDYGVVGYRGGDREGRKFFNHMPAARIRELIGEEIWESYFKFTIVRNPFDRLVSAFYFKQGSMHGDRQVSDRSSDVERFRTWLREGGGNIDRDVYMIGEDVCMDFFIRYESLEEGMRHVCERIGVAYEPESLAWLKGGYRDHSIPLPEFYDSKTREIAAEKYAFELDYFGYEFPGG